MSLKEQMLAGRIAESDAVEDAAEVLVSLEHQQLRVAVDLAEAADIDAPDAGDLPDPEQRKGIIQDLAVALATDSFGEWWAAELAREWDAEPPAELVDIGADAEAWQEKLDLWADRVREEHPEIEASRRELASVVSRDIYGVDVEEIEQRLVEVSREETVNQTVTGNFAAVQRIMARAAEELRDEPADEGSAEGS
jgi:hypothetical protein